MSTAEKIASLIVGVALVTTLVLPKRQTPAVINATSGLFSGALATAMGTGLPNAQGGVTSTPNVG
jgi:hypothetical protein